MATKSGNLKPVYIVIGVLVIAGLAAWTFASFRTSSSEQVAATYSTTVSGSVVTAGKAAPTTVDIYEDFLCPICGNFEARDGGAITKAINDGKIQVRYHPVAILNRATNPPGYSLRAGNAAVCSADAGFFAAYHTKLFAEQPSEGSAGLTDQELIAKGQEVGAPATFAQCVTSGKHAKAISAETQRAGKDTSLRAEGSKSFGTPTVVVNGKRADISDNQWLDNVTQQ
ncbi:MAG TPA: thioredoxin domain-containing protein [Pseudonocardia sp.]|jgi:protein-disulfide isomerase